MDSEEALDEVRKGVADVVSRFPLYPDIRAELG